MLYCTAQILRALYTRQIMLNINCKLSQQSVLSKQSKWQQILHASLEITVTKLCILLPDGGSQGQEVATSQHCLMAQYGHHLTALHQVPQAHLPMGSKKFRSTDLLGPASKSPYEYTFNFKYSLSRSKYAKMIVYCVLPSKLQLLEKPSGHDHCSRWIPQQH